MTARKIAVLGAGSWGTALAMVLAENGHDVRLWTHHQDQADEMIATGKNARYLPDLQLPKNISITSDLALALEGAELINFVVPTKAMRQVASQVLAVFQEAGVTNLPILMHASKGLEQGSHLRISQILEDVFSPLGEAKVVVLSGPSHAEEVAQHDITAITAAGTDQVACDFVQEVFMNDYFRVYTNPDIIGVELGGSLKNIIALGAGALVGAGFGDNAKAALLTRGLAEITRLGVTMGANPLTFMGLSGVGDLVVTATSVHSRNWRAGQQIGQGQSVEEVEAHMGMVVEGLATAVSAYELAQEKGVEMPITQAIYLVIKEGLSIKEVVTALMTRERKGELQFEDNLADLF
ncbi:NAD(P)H-dependent glycerol-3-phosphate dehydrogenase [Aerococcus agrisoli]|uniref:Glycerol-3-phosphate dehydrogenase [NAD(P)+] n=1 Tax=Aerococcus agrisoli TaxID=2487350 RepID=A0A3N4GRA2_9LACT|nr:NAD(P)H-dependent glycerol-3-phosphate dehydrogenase [Aerococcus agrisoli]RPA65489.1 NAD(P)H-dependent glycerol-3-phosphate dehydrogenase [Aerococcus agrisoli]